MHSVLFPLGPLETNCYLLHTESQALIIDVGGDPAEVLNYLRQHKLSLSHILCTHLHFDHTFGVQALQKATGATVQASDKDRFLLEERIPGIPPVQVYSFSNLEAGPLSVLGTTCMVLSTPGHTPGGLSFHFPEYLAVFAGDSLFYRSIGRTDFPRGDFNTLASSIREQLFALPEETAVYPGHGPRTSIGEEKRHNPYLGGMA
ncbi:MAG: MBL fold metallo-hydrolase [Deltaproteobacteria bacterium]|jgi:glyoxylase-like metal-dependent hydrolase (beta-lactamase superfamily II)|nr:MBL fold metallo-hydrolase [Deltaproteobacteria bacterium]